MDTELFTYSIQDTQSFAFGLGPEKPRYTIRIRKIMGKVELKISNARFVL